MANKKKYAIVDIETTGGQSKRDKITEIAIVIFDGEKIIDQYSSLINPERSVPNYITRITGITDDMVEGAPKFYEVAKEIVEKTEGTIFVAHNVKFDYGFIKEEFSKLGYTYTKKLLCTVKMSRKHLPGLKSYSLENLIKHFKINVQARHRALDDALATTVVLQKILAAPRSEESINQFINNGIKESLLPKGLDLNKLHLLPEGPGVYYFLNSFGQVIYVGKSINIKKRVMQHFSKMTEKSLKMWKSVAQISFEETGNELIALLLESKEIKTLQPEINRAQRTKDYPYFIHHFMDTLGYINFELLKSSIKRRRGKQILNNYGTKIGAIAQLNGLTKQFQLCPKKMHLESDAGPCFDYKIGQCYGACVLEESTADYNERAEEAIEKANSYFDKNMILLDKGRNNDEAAVILVEHGDYHGYGYISQSESHTHIESLKECIDYETPNPETNRIIRTYLERKSVDKIIHF